MTSDAEQKYRELILAYAKGEKPLSELPVEESGFWESAAVRAARPGRSSMRAPNLGVTAERLLRGPVSRKAEAAKIDGLIACLNQPDMRVRREAMHLLREVPPNPKTIAAAHKAIHDPDKDVQVGALFLLSDSASAQTVDELIDVLTRTHDFRSTIASEALARVGKRAVPGIAKLLDESDTTIRWRATICLSRINDPVTKAPLLKALHDDSPNVAWVAADGLLNLGPEVSIDVLRSILNEPLDGSVIRALHHYSEHASPASIFRKVEQATAGLGVGASALTAVSEALEKLETRK